MTDTATVLPILVRPALASDLGFVMNSWLKSFAAHRESFFAARIAAPGYYAGHHEILTRLLQHCACSVAHAADDPGQICGWAAHEPGVVHYIYVKQVYRHFGIARMLLEYCGVAQSDAITVSHWTPAADGLLRQLNRKDPSISRRMTINPYLAVTPKDNP